MFEADVPADWCAPNDSVPPMSLPSWLKPEIASAPDPSRMPPIVAAPTMPPAPPPSRPHAARVEDRGDGLLAVEGAPASVPTPSRRFVPLPAPPMPCADPAEIEKLSAALVEAVAVGVRARREALAAAERDLVHLALAIAGKVVGREVAADPAVVARWAHEGIRALGEQDQIAVAISPDLAERLPLDEWARALDGIVPVVDRSLPPGGCEVRGSYGRVDAGLAPRLASVAETLEEALSGVGSEAA
jgi:hypothetical protein